MLTGPAQADESSQVFSFAGVIEDFCGANAPSTLRSGIARALSRDQLIRILKGWGFQVTSVCELAELVEMIGVLEAIAGCDDTMGDTDYVNLLPTHAGKRAPENVFTFSGEYAGQPGAPFAGFAVAASAAQLQRELGGLMFDVTSTLSLKEAVALLAEMRCVETDDDGYINLVSLANAA